MKKRYQALIKNKSTFVRRLRKWFRSHKRDLPWRSDPSLYKTVVSEFMLQQTQVKTVLPYFERWLRIFPDFASLAAAPEEKVIKHWEGLGYYHRARNLRKLAIQLGKFPAPPTTRQEWQKLPGVGPYTAAAITSIAFGENEAVVDGNVIRILTRLAADNTTYKSSTEAASMHTPKARKLRNAVRPR